MVELHEDVWSRYDIRPYAFKKVLPKFVLRYILKMYVIHTLISYILYWIRFRKN